MVTIISHLLSYFQWDSLYNNKPDDNSNQDPKDLSAIKDARDSIGDYKLKTAEDYVVPEGQRVNADIKLMQLLQLLNQVINCCFLFYRNVISQSTLQAC